MRIRRYRSLVALAIVLVGAGAASASPALVVAAVLPLVFVLQGTIARTPTLEGALRVERELDPETPLPGEPVEVTLRVENTGETAVPDLRFVDGVPDELGVADGSPRGGDPLPVGGTVSTTYTLVATRGAYEFDAVNLRARNVSGTRLDDLAVRADGDDGFECRVTAEDVPIRRDTTPYTGPLATDTGGPGVEFYATREYRSGDPVKRINWHRYAKTGDLSTIEYREQRAAHVAVVIDSRPPAHVAADDASPTGATLCAYAGTLAIGVLAEAGHHVSLAALGTPDPVSGRRAPAWVSADETSSFAARAAAVCNNAATGPDETVSTRTAPIATDGGRGESRRLRSLLPAGAQVFLCTPALDDEVVDFAESIRADGHELTVLSPDVASNTVGGRVAALERAARLERLRVLGAAVVDWDREERLPVALGRSLGTEVR